VFAGVSALVVRQAAVVSGHPNPRSISASLLGQLLTSYQTHSDQAGTESVSRSHARCLPAQMQSRRRIAPGQSLRRQWWTPHPGRRTSAAKCSAYPPLPSASTYCDSTGSVNVLGRNGFRRRPISPSAPTAARPVRICARCPRRECRRTGTQGYCCQRSCRESWPAGSRR
jgi:hypothetical protein